MARPKKDPAMRMDTDLRIPFTSEQKEIIVEATKDEPEGMASWARSLLLSAAKQKIAMRKGNESEKA